MARVESDNTQLKLENARLTTDLSEVHDDLRILHPLPYARLHFEKCINRQIACNEAVNAFIDLHTLKVINVTPSLSHQLQELKRELKKAWDARFAASHLCDPPPTLANVLHIMAERGFTKEVKKCMNLNQATRSCKMLQKVMREVKGKYEWTQLHYFVWKGMKSSVNRMLSMKGVDVESRSINGNTPLITASGHGRVEIVEILLNHGAKIESKSNKGGTPLYLACQQGHLHVITLLINKGANIEASTTDGMRQLHIACQNGHLPVVSLLINKGANIEASTIDGSKPLHIACQHGNLPVFTFLINKGANIEASDNTGFRPLHNAAWKGHLEIVKALIAKGAVMNALSNTGQSALGIARRFNHTTIVTYLRSLGAIDDGLVLADVA